MAEGSSYPLPTWVPWVSGALGAGIAVACGRKDTRLDNALIGGLFTGFASYRDPRASVMATVMVALIEGAIWGLTDRTTPLIKDALLPSGHGGESVAASLAPPATAGLGAYLANGRRRNRRRR